MVVVGADVGVLDGTFSRGVIFSEALPCAFRGFGFSLEIATAALLSGKAAFFDSFQFD